MGAIDAFMTTWSNARQTLGEGTPQEGAPFDNSNQLRQMQTSVQSAAPGERWTGSAADGYATANNQQSQVLGQMAGLDQRLGSEVDRSAAVVTAGRQNLDGVKQWVLDASASVPAGENREQQLLPIARKGIGDVADVVKQTNGDLNTIGGRIQAIGNEYKALGDPDGKDPVDKATGDGGPQIVTPEKDPLRIQARDNVDAAVHGNQGAAQWVNGVLNSVSPDQLSGKQPLSPQQNVVLSQLQSQQQDMSVEQLKAAEKRLGDQKGMVGNSLQLLSNPNIQFDKSTGDQTYQHVNGGLAQLPQDVQKALTDPPAVRGNFTQIPMGYPTMDKLQSIAGIVQDGNPALQHGTDLDRGLMGRGAEILAAAQTVSGPDTNMPNHGLQDIFRAGSNDHIVDTELISGKSQSDLLLSRDPLIAQSIGGDQFMQNVTHHTWDDKGGAVASVFSWTEASAHGPEAQIAGEAASAYSNYLGNHAHDLLHLSGNHTIGQIDPALVNGFARGLAPYVGNIAGEHNDLTQWFPSSDPDEGNLHKVGKGIFSVISTDDNASKYFNGKAYEEIVRDQNSYAQQIANHQPGAVLNDADLQNAQILKGLVDSGVSNAVEANGVNEHDRATRAYELKSQAYSAAATVLGAAGSAAGGPVVGTGVGVLAPLLQEAVLGPKPPVEGGGQLLQQMQQYDVYGQVLDGLAANHVPIDLGHEFFVPPGGGSHDGTPRIATWQEYQHNGGTLTETQYNSALATALDKIVPGQTPVIGLDATTYNSVIDAPHPWNNKNDSP